MDLVAFGGRRVWIERPFVIDAVVALPEYLYVWTLPAGDADYSGRWRAIKARFSRALVFLHRLVDDPFDWRWSSIHAYTRRGVICAGRDGVFGE